MWHLPVLNAAVDGFFRHFQEPCGLPHVNEVGDNRFGSKRGFWIHAEGRHVNR